MTNFERIAVSAPGKVLLSGGYLITDRAYTGLVLGLDARIHVIVEGEEAASSPPPSPPSHQNLEVLVKSPQFSHAEWPYTCLLLDRERGYEVTQRFSGPHNPFVEAALCYGLTYISHSSRHVRRPRNLQKVTFTIIADDKYYSQSHTSTNCPHKPDSEFVHFNVTLADAHKTGLGSSAALVTAFTGALLHAFTHVAADKWGLDDWKAKTNALAQAAHCTAQGKIGSGFDVAAAVWGSCLYRRFSATVLEKIGEVNSPGFAPRLVSVVEDTSEDGQPRTPALWDMECDPAAIAIPKRLRLVMCDVDQGSSTPGMVKKVLAWRKAHPEAAGQLWKRLEQGTQNLSAELRAMAADAGRSTAQLANIFQTIRQGLREMSEQADVPIEPREQTLLLDALTAMPSVVGAVVPGAGGYDALALLIEDSESVLPTLQIYLDGVVEGSRLALAQHGLPAPKSRVQVLDIKPDLTGLATEVPTRYDGWIGV